jgi:hypothetical protein
LTLPVPAAKLLVKFNPVCCRLGGSSLIARSLLADRVAPGNFEAPAFEVESEDGRMRTSLTRVMKLLDERDAATPGFGAAPVHELPTRRPSASGSTPT